MAYKFSILPTILRTLGALAALAGAGLGAFMASLAPALWGGWGMPERVLGLLLPLGPALAGLALNLIARDGARAEEAREYEALDRAWCYAEAEAAAWAEPYDRGTEDILRNPDT